MPTDAAAAVAPAPPAPMVPVRYRVSGRDQETADAVTLSLTPVDEPIREPQPGQFTMLYAFGVGEVPISVSGCPGVEGELRHTIRAVGATDAGAVPVAPRRDGRSPGSLRRRMALTGARI